MSVGAKRLEFDGPLQFYDTPPSTAPTDLSASKDSPGTANLSGRQGSRPRLCVPAPPWRHTPISPSADSDWLMQIARSSPLSRHGLVALTGRTVWASMFQNRGELSSPCRTAPQLYAPGKLRSQRSSGGSPTRTGGPRCFPSGSMGGTLHAQGHAQVISNIVDFDLGRRGRLQPALAPRGGTEPTGDSSGSTGRAEPETGVPRPPGRRSPSSAGAGPQPRLLGRLQAIHRHPPLTRRPPREMPAGWNRAGVLMPILTP